jgi:hypothetical protein
VQLSYKGLVSEEVLASEQQRLETGKRQAETLLETAELHAHDIDSALNDALAKTQTPYATYLASSPLERRLLNQTFFERVLVGEDATIEGAVLTPVYSALSAWEPSLGQPTAPRRTIRRREGSCANPDPLLRGRGSHKNGLVETAGIEPASAVAWVWRLRA